MVSNGYTYIWLTLEEYCLITLKSFYYDLSQEHCQNKILKMIKINLFDFLSNLKSITFFIYCNLFGSKWITISLRNEIVSTAIDTTLSR